MLYSILTHFLLQTPKPKHSTKPAWVIKHPFSISHFNIVGTSGATLQNLNWAENLTLTQWWRPRWISDLLRCWCLLVEYFAQWQQQHVSAKKAAVLTVVKQSPAGFFSGMLCTWPPATQNLSLNTKWNVRLALRVLKEPKYICRAPPGLPSGKPPLYIFAGLVNCKWKQESAHALLRWSTEEVDGWIW